MTKTIFSYILHRFAEPSSYAGLAGLLLMAGVELSPEAYGWLVQTLAGFCAFVAFAVRDGGVKIHRDGE